MSYFFRFWEKGSPCQLNNSTQKNPGNSNDAEKPRFGGYMFLINTQWI